MIFGELYQVIVWPSTGEGVCLWGQGNFWDEMGINYWSVASLRQDGEEKIEENMN